MKRRDFLLGTAGIVGTTLPALGHAQSKPCPPPTFQVTGGSSGVSTCESPVLTDAPAWMQGRGVNEWFEIPGTRLSSCPPSQGAQYGSPGSKINAWCGATLRRQGSIYLIAAAGGHGDYGGNEVNALRLSADDPAWVELRPSTVTADIVNNSAVYLDYRKAASHTYNTTQFIEQDDRLVIMPYAGLFASSMPDASAQWQAWYPEKRVTASFSAVDWTAYNAGNDWDRAQMMAETGTPRRGFYPTLPSNYVGAGWGMMGCSDPLTGDLYTGDNAAGLWRMKRSAGTWSQVSGSFALSAYGAAICVDQVVRNGEPYRRLMVVSQNGAGIQGVYRLDTAAKLTGAMGLASGSQPWSVLDTGHYHGIVYDSGNDRFIAFINGADGNFAQYEIKYVTPTTYRITKIPLVAGSGSTVPNVVGRNGIHNAIQYVPDLKGVVIADGYDRNVHFMRTS